MIKFGKSFVLLLSLALFLGIDSFSAVFATELVNMAVDENAVEQCRELKKAYDNALQRRGDAFDVLLNSETDPTKQVELWKALSDKKIRDSLLQNFAGDPAKKEEVLATYNGWINEYNWLDKEFPALVSELMKNKNRPTLEKMKEALERYAPFCLIEKIIMQQTPEELANNSLFAPKDNLDKMIQEGKKEADSVGMLWSHGYSFDSEKRVWKEEKPMLSTATLCDFGLETPEGFNRTLVSCAHVSGEDDAIKQCLDNQERDIHGFFNAQDANGKLLKIKIFYIPWVDNLPSTRFEDGTSTIPAIPVEKIAIGHAKGATSEGLIDAAMFRLKSPVPHGQPLKLKPANLAGLTVGEKVVKSGTFNGFGMGYCENAPNNKNAWPTPKYDEQPKPQDGLGNVLAISEASKAQFAAFDAQIMHTGWQKPKMRFVSTQLSLNPYGTVSFGKELVGGPSDSGGALRINNHGTFIINGPGALTPLTPIVAQDMWRRLWSKASSEK